MNRILRIALIILCFSAFNCLPASARTSSKVKKEDVIILDVTKNETISSDENKEKSKHSSSLMDKIKNYDAGDVENDTVNDNVDVEFSIFDNLIDKDKEADHPFKIEEESLFGRIYKKKLERTSIPSYLLQDELTFKYKNGPVDKVQFYGAFQGNFNSLFEGSDYDTTYDLNIFEAGVVGSLKKVNTDFKLQMNFKPVEGVNFMQGFITDAYLMNLSIPHHKIIVGNSRNQVGVDGGASSYTLPFAMRSQIARNFGNTRALGVRVVGDYSLVDYSLALNSSDRFFQEFFPGAEFTGWVNFKPLGRTGGKYGHLVIGTGLNAGHRNENYTVGGAYVGYSYKKFAANAEYSIADGYNGRNFSTNKATGFYTTVSYRLTQKLHVLARFDQFDPNRDISGDLRREYTAGLNYFIKGQALRLILNYVFCDNENEEDSHRIILGTQILL